VGTFFIALDEALDVTAPSQLLRSLREITGVSGLLATCSVSSIGGGISRTVPGAQVPTEDSELSPASSVRPR
jgi:hypothetical protein